MITRAGGQKRQAQRWWQGQATIVRQTGEEGNAVDAVKDAQMEYLLLAL